MENMDKGLSVPKWALINRPKIPQMLKFICPSPKNLDFMKKKASLQKGGSKQKGFRVQARDFVEKGLQWAFVVLEPKHA